MKAYGVPRISDAEWPDVADIHNYGRKSSVGTFTGRSGDHRGYCRNKAAKQATRRRWARKARKDSKALCTTDS